MNEKAEIPDSDCSEKHLKTLVFLELQTSWVLFDYCSSQRELIVYLSKFLNRFP